AEAADELLLEIDQALEPHFDSVPDASPNREDTVPLTDWADGPGSSPANDLGGPAEPGQSSVVDGENGLPLPSFGLDGAAPEPTEGAYGQEEKNAFAAVSMGEDSFGFATADEEEDATDEDGDSGESDDRGRPAYGSLLKMPLELARSADKPSLSFASLDDGGDEAAEFPPDDVSSLDVSSLHPGEMGLGDWLAAARE